MNKSVLIIEDQPTRRATAWRATLLTTIADMRAYVDASGLWNFYP